MDKLKKKINKILKKVNVKKIKKEVIFYLKTNILTLVFLGVNLFNGILLRFMTVKNYSNIKPIFGDLIVLLVIIAFAYLHKPKRQFRYYLIWTIILSLLCFVNCIYYANYISFASLSLLKTTSQLGGYTSAVTTLLELKWLLFFIAIPILVWMDRRLKAKKYYDKVTKIEIGKVRMMITAILCLFIFIIFVSMITSRDVSRLKKQWDRRYTVMEFGIYTYQINDIVSTIKTKANTLFSSDDAYLDFINFLDERKDSNKKNKYTNIFQGKNVIVIHGESIQGFTMNLKFNGKELTPNVNKLAKEGMYFSNFYTQESIGNSSDSEFTSLTSLLPASSGTVFVNYFKRKYVTITDLLRQKGYYTFSMHGNVASAWNRANAYNYLGYDHFYAYDSAYEIDEVLGLGLSDKSFFSQSVDIIDEIKKNNGKFYGTLIMLTNHTPFNSLVDTDYYDDYLVDLEDGEEVIPYLEGTKMGNYLKSVNYADSAIGEFIKKLDENGLLDNTIIVLYGDHDSKIKKSEFERLYYNENIDKVLINPNKKIEVVDNYTYEINRKVPYIIWSKDMAGTEYNEEISKVMGMVDVVPTLGNMLGVYDEFAIGHDIFSVEDNIVVFPSGNFITDKVYYEASTGEYLQLRENTSVSIDSLISDQEYASKVLSLSNNIIVYDLINKYYNSLESLE